MTTNDIEILREALISNSRNSEDLVEAYTDILTQVYLQSPIEFLNSYSALKKFDIEVEDFYKVLNVEVKFKNDLFVFENNQIIQMLSMMETLNNVALSAAYTRVLMDND